MHFKTNQFVHKVLMLGLFQILLQHNTNKNEELAEANDYSSPWTRIFFPKLQRCPWGDGTLQRILQTLDISGKMKDTSHILYNQRPRNEPALTRV